MMATFLYTPEPDEQVRMIHPKGAHWSLDELQDLVGGYIEVVRTIDNRFMVINDMGKVIEPHLPLNKNATRIYRFGLVDPIVGPAVVVDTLEELEVEDGN
jgi:hypothetical protein